MGQQYSPINLEYTCPNCETIFVVDFSLKDDNKYIDQETTSCPVCGEETKKVEIIKVS